MAIKPSPDRSDLESKTREDLQTIAKVKGVDTPARASKAALIEAIMGEPSDAAPASPSRAVRSRRTVATPVDDFEELLGEFVADAKVPAAAVATATAAPAVADTVDNGGGEVLPSERPARQQFTQTRPERQPREFADGSNNRSRRNRRNRNGSGNGNAGSGNGRDRYNGGESMPNADQPYAGELVEVEGLLDLRDDGYGFLRTKGYHASTNDVYVSINQVRRYHLRKGDTIVGGFRPAASNEKYPALLRVDSVAGIDPEVARLRPRFEDLTPLFPDEKLNLETNEGKLDLTPRIVDLLAPIGKGQRGLIVSPPKAGKTTIMKQIAQSIETNNPEVHLMVLLVDERPEEVTDIRRSVRGEVISSTFDRPAEEHTHVAELCIERAKRLVEQGRDVVIILDGITRLARAYNLAAPATGRIMSGGVDSGALYPPKKFFGAARNIEEGGSLTILASALVETGSKMDEVIFEEFKGTGNMELRLDRRLAERRLYPAIDVNASSTRHEELLFSREALPQVWKLRRVLNGLSAEGRDAAGLELLIDKLKTTKSNDEFLAEIAGGPAPTS
jgi:transcription termination factor Rho